ncbi:hypothetical protein [Streptomyces sp. SP18BB07]|uniref:hypothetical protein n=1 Tax=Streptomyces sp. SP18BB07 TaxID=3002522 RepID=UPI002E75CE11|nr:hypothetical protein [Streptomyces sp. SP18BB07]MEE1764426.1 hypothetical protein [Streptomyces sp. SP18BB07]
MSFGLDEREQAKQFAAYFKGLEDRLAALERSNQLNNASIEGGSLDIYDAEGTLKGSIGVQPDGAVALVPDRANTDPPPAPTAPAVESALAGLLIGWDGQWDDASEAPSDFALIQVHVGATEDFTPDVATQVATITAPLGGSVTVHIEGYDPVWVCLVAQNTAALTGTPSPTVQGQARQAVTQDLIDGMITEVKLAENAVTAAKIALGAVNATALADGAVLAEKLAANAVTQAKLANGAVTALALADEAVTAAKVAAGAIDSAKLADAAVTAAKIGNAAVTTGKIAAQAVNINALTAALADSASQRWVDAMGDSTAWTVTQLGTGASWTHLNAVADAPTGQTVGQATGFVRLRGTVQMPYDPDVLYRVSARIRATAQPTTADVVYVGLLGIGADGATLVNRDGANSANSQHYVAASAKPVATADGWVNVIGFVKGRAATGSAGPNNDPRSPGTVHANVRFVAPYVWLNYNNQSAAAGTMQVDAVTIEALKTGVVDSINLVAGSVTAAAIAADAVTATQIAAGAVTAAEIAAGAVTTAKLAAGAVTAAEIAANTITAGLLAANSVTAAALAANSVQTAALAADSVAAGKIAADAITARELAANSVTASEISAGAVTANAIAAGAVTTEKLTVVGGSNVLPDPSFEGAGGAAIAAKQAWLSIDHAFGNGTPASLKIDATSATAAYRSAELALLPITAGDQVYIAADYYPSTDWVGSEINMHIRWEKANGTVLSFSKLVTATPTKGAWARFTGAFTAPAEATQGRVRVESGNGTAGSVWWDNAAVRPVVPGVQIADGAITAPKIVAGAVTTDKLTALSVTAEKIASLAVTTDKLSALSVTADKLAVNSVTATAIAAGVIDATHIKAGSLTADRLAIGANGDNLIADPSFEGAVTAQRVVGFPAWTVVSGGRDTAKALRQDATANSELPLLGPIPAMPGQKMYLAADYYASTDWAGDHVLIYAEWQDASGTTLNWSNITAAGNMVKGAWTRIAGIGSLAAPSGTAQVIVRLKSLNSTAGNVLWDNAVARFVTASGTSGSRAEISPLGLQLYDADGDEAVSLMTGRPNYLTMSTDGLPVATIDQDGGAGFQRLAVADTLTVAGADLSEYLNALPRGIQAIDYQVSTRTASATEMGFVELACEIDATRMYRFVFSARANPSAAGGELQLRLRDGGTGTPTITSTQRYQSVYHMGLGNSFTPRMEHVESGAAIGAGLHRFLITFTNALGPSGQTCEMYGSSTSRGYFYIEDVGPVLPETGGYNDGGGTVAQPPTKYTKTYSATWSGSYSSRSSYNSFYGNSCYQGYYSSTNGTQAALIGFPSSLATDLSGAVIQKAEVYLYFDHWYANAGGKAVIKAHSHTSRPSTFSSDSESKTVSWARNEGKWVDITSVFDSTSWRGIALDPNSTSTTFYGRARGYGQTNPPKLKVTYTK